MENIWKQWKRFLLSENRVKYSGILMIKPTEMVLSELEALQAMLPESAKRLERKDLHDSPKCFETFSQKVKEYGFARSSDDYFR